MERIVVYASRRHIYRKLALCVGLLALGVALLGVHVARWVGYALALAGGAWALILLKSLGEETERVVIDDAGIRDSSLPVGIIGWDEVRDASVEMIGSVPVIQLRVRDPERFIRRLPSGRQFIARKAAEAGLPGLYINLVGTEAEPSAIAAAIRARVRPAANDRV
jgi:hypothetical protein